MRTETTFPRHLLTGLCLTAILAPASPVRAGFLAQPAAMRSATSAAAPAAANDQVPQESAFLRVILPKHELVVGELVPVKVKAYFRAGVSASLNGLPLLGSDAFSLNKLDDHPEQGREMLNGVPYTVVTWTTALSAVKAGDYALNIELPIMLRVKEKPQRRGRAQNPFKDFFGDNSPFGDFGFDDSFFDDFFAQSTEKPLTLHAQGDSLKIDSLPAAGRPAGFTGAVGKFEISGALPTATASAGDPLSLKIAISGTGNFDRVTTAGLPASAAWKSYPASGKFEPDNAAGTDGTKTFTQSIVPLEQGSQKVPAISFSYFDPEAHRYVTKQTDPLSLEVAPGAPASPPVPASTAPVASPLAAPAAHADGLAPDEPLTGNSVGSLRPLVRTPWFLLLNGAFTAVLAVGTGLRIWRSRRQADPERLNQIALERATREAMAALAEAQAAHDAPRFFSIARQTLQEQLAARWHVPVAQVSISEIRNRLNGEGEELRSIFNTADAIAYSGRRFSTSDLQPWRNAIENELQHISRL